MKKQPSKLVNVNNILSSSLKKKNEQGMRNTVEC